MLTYSAELFADDGVEEPDTGGDQFVAEVVVRVVDGVVVLATAEQHHAAREPLGEQAEVLAATQPLLTLAANDVTGTGAVVTPAITGVEANSPACSTYYQQRQVYGGSTSQPQTLWFSGAGTFNNMAVSQPTRDSDAITRSLTGRQVDEIRHLVPVGTNLMILTAGAEWRCWPGTGVRCRWRSSC